jgi:class 3 adenylate cyclase
MQRLKVAGPDLEAKHGMRPQIRMGLNTGAAVVAKAEDGDDAGDAVLGVTVNLAARLQVLAELDAVFMSEAIHPLGAGDGGRKLCGRARGRGANPCRRGPIGSRASATVRQGPQHVCGRQLELKVLERGFGKAQHELLSVIDIVAHE